MPRGDKSKYTAKQDRKAQHIEQSYEARGTPRKEAQRRAWATVNKESGGGKLSGSGRGRAESHVASRRGGRIGGGAAAARPAAARSKSARKAAATRARRGGAAGAARVSGSARRGAPSRSPRARAPRRSPAG